MKKNLYDMAEEKALKWINQAVGKLTNESKHMNPYGQEPLSEDKLLEYYDAFWLDPEAYPYMVGKYGETETEKILKDISELSIKKRGTP